MQMGVDGVNSYIFGANRVCPASSGERHLCGSVALNLSASLPNPLSLRLCRSHKPRNTTS